MLPNKTYFTDLLRPWKLFTFAIGMGWLLLGAVTYDISDWDVGVSILMGGLTYLCAPWSIRVTIYSIRFRNKYWQLWIVCAFSIALFVIDGSYFLYHTIIGNQMLRIENFYASSALYFLAGTIWMYQGSLRDFVNECKAIFIIKK
jgi:hypothetical protein